MLIEEKGFKSATMKQIAGEAGIADATIYNYFPTKEAILYGYYLDHLNQCIDDLKNIPDFHTFTFQEQIQTFFDKSLELLLSDREFVRRTHKIVLLNSSRDWAQIKPIRNLFISVVQDMIQAAEEVNEIPELVFEDLVSQLFLDAYIGMIHYWVKDRSEQFTNTHTLTDQGLTLACALLKAGIPNKMFDLATFIFKTHILNRMDRFTAPLSRAGKLKKRFMDQME